MRKKSLSDIRSIAGRKGANSVNASRTPAERREKARAAARARWATDGISETDWHQAGQRGALAGKKMGLLIGRSDGKLDVRKLQDSTTRGHFDKDRWLARFWDRPESHLVSELQKLGADGAHILSILSVACDDHEGDRRRRIKLLQSLSESLRRSADDLDLLSPDLIGEISFGSSVLRLTARELDASRKVLLRFTGRNAIDAIDMAICRLDAYIREFSSNHVTDTIAQLLTAAELGSHEWGQESVSKRIERLKRKDPEVAKFITASEYAKVHVELIACSEAFLAGMKTIRTASDAQIHKTVSPSALAKKK